MNKNTIKVGDKQKHITIPDGYEQVMDGYCLEGDKYLYIPNWRDWKEVENDDIGLPIKDNFDCVIRKSIQSS